MILAFFIAKLQNATIAIYGQAIRNVTMGIKLTLILVLGSANWQNVMMATFGTLTEERNSVMTKTKSPLTLAFCVSAPSALTAFCGSLMEGLKNVTMETWTMKTNVSTLAKWRNVKTATFGRKMGELKSVTTTMTTTMTLVSTTVKWPNAETGTPGIKREAAKNAMTKTPITMTHV